MYINLCACIYICVPIFVCVNTRTKMYACIDIYTYTHTHTHICTHTHTHTHTHTPCPMYIKIISTHAYSYLHMYIITTHTDIYENITESLFPHLKKTKKAPYTISDCDASKGVFSILFRVVEGGRMSHRLDLV